MPSWNWRATTEGLSLASPLSDLTNKGQLDSVWWTDKVEYGLQKLTAALTSNPVLRNPDFNLPFILQMDTSKVYLVLFISCKLSTGERK